MKNKILTGIQTALAIVGVLVVGYLLFINLVESAITNRIQTIADKSKECVNNNGIPFVVYDKDNKPIDISCLILPGE